MEKRVTEAWTAEHLKQAILLCTTFKRTGVVLAWWLVAAQRASFLDDIVFEFSEPWLREIARHKSSSKRFRGATFPLRLGDLQCLVEVFSSNALVVMTDAAEVNTWAQRAWAFVSMWGLNRLAGVDPRPKPGSWSTAERAACESLLAAAGRRCAHDTAEILSTEESWQKDLSSRQVGYNGEEVSVCHELSMEQVLPALPPENHGGCINSLDWVSLRTKRFLLNPLLLLKDPEDVVLPKMPGHIHVKASDKMLIACELVRRNVCTWIPLESVYSVKGVRVLNGMFGVCKPTSLEDGRPILRVIMNLTGSNATQIQLEGGCSSLPMITSWQSIVLDGSETLSLHQSDMSSAFYLFKIPGVWQRHLAFNIIAKGEHVGGIYGQDYALACSVIPMGWLNSVGIMQEISERLLGAGNLGSEHRLARGYALPPWMNQILSESKSSDKSWWHVYLDNFAGGERIQPEETGDSALLCHQAAERAWSSAGVVSSEKKRVSCAQRITELGAEVDGELGMLGLSNEKLVKLIQATLWMLAQRFLQKKTVQIIAGRWMFGLQFRRPAMSFVQKTWDFIAGKLHMGSEMRRLVKAEFLSLVLCAPLLHCNLGAKISPVVVCSDASEKGGSVDIGLDLTDEGRDFLQACEKKELTRGTEHGSFLIVSLFNGIGGAFRCYDLLGILPRARIAVDIDEAANRITTRRWPGCIMVKDVRSIDREMVKGWSLKFLDVTEVHVWGGWPCVDLSSVKFGRLNLAGPQSKLFWEIPRILQLFKDEFGEQVEVKHVLENVASMDEAAAQEISSEMGTVPYRLDSADAVPMRRPRFAWSSERVEGIFPDIQVLQGRYWKEVKASATYPATAQWLTPGWTWAGEDEGTVFPTCLKSIPRESPPPRPAGLDKTSWEAQERWKSDSYRYPPYQYAAKFLLTNATSWRLLNASEKELLGYGFNHTKLAWNASRVKQDEIGFSDCRHRLLGDCYSCYSFVILAAACARKFLPQISYQHVTNRMGLAPGFCAHIRGISPLQRQLSYGSARMESEYFNRGMERLNRLMLRRTNHTGSDIRVLTGEIFNSKAFPRESVCSSWWTWQRGFTTKWKQKNHINVLELESILLGIKFQIQMVQSF